MSSNIQILHLKKLTAQIHMFALRLQYFRKFQLGLMCSAMCGDLKQNDDSKGYK